MWDVRMILTWKMQKFRQRLCWAVGWRSKSILLEACVSTCNRRKLGGDMDICYFQDVFAIFRHIRHPLFKMGKCFTTGNQFLITNTIDHKQVKTGWFHTTRNHGSSWTNPTNLKQTKLMQISTGLLDRAHKNQRLEEPALNITVFLQVSWKMIWPNLTKVHEQGSPLVTNSTPRACAQVVQRI